MTTETMKRTPGADALYELLKARRDDAAYVLELRARIAELEAGLREIVTVSTTTVYPKESLDRARALLEGK